MVTQSKESKQVERARKKIQQRFAADDEKMTPAAIDSALDHIHYWLNRHKSERIDLKEKKICKDEDSIKSKYVVHLIDKLKTFSAGKVSKKDKD